MGRMFDYGSIIYKSESINAETVDNYKMIKATADIKMGELLLLEHVYAADTVVCQLVVENNEAMYDMYHPRNTPYTETDPTERRVQSRDKITHNCFGLGGGKKLLNVYLQQINHSCTANCAVYVQEKYSIEDVDVVFMELYAVKNISAGTELTINYGPKNSHGRDFECKCGLPEKTRNRIFDITVSLVKNISDQNQDEIKKLVYDYLKLKSTKKILLNQYLAVNGIYINNNTVSAYDKQGVGMINDLIHKYLGIKGTIDSETVKEVEMNNHKIGLFLQIVNNYLLRD